MKLCPNCKVTYADDANFCPQESCATDNGPQRLQAAPDATKARFQLLSRMGGAGTGEIWRAQDSESGAEVAYKLVAPEVVPNATAFARTERELKQLVRVRSPKIASVLDVGKAADDRLYVAMELCEGEPLDRLLRNGPLPLDKAKSIVGQIGQALLEAQKVGVVHRDVAPKNVLVSANGEVKVINFALAKPLSDKVAGVAAYLSPEQAQGKPVDQRSNTYSLGAIFYHLVTGEPPFQGSNAQAVLELHVSSPPLAPSQRRPEGNLSPELDRVVLKSLDKSSSRRHLTLRLFLSEIEALTGAAPVATSAGPTGGRDVGFAKTMLFAGGQAEVANLVAKAIAARGGGSAAGAAPAAAAPVAPQVSHGAVARMAVAPAAAAPEPASLSRLTPPPATPHPVASAPAAASAMEAASADDGKQSAGSQKAGSAFRETLWFKKGDVEHMIAEAKAKMGTSAAAEVAAKAAAESAAEVAAAAAPTEDIRLIEDRYIDDGTVTTDDRKKFSLRTGGTATALPAVGKVVPGKRMNEEEMVSEMAGGRKTLILALVAVVVVVAVAVMVTMMRKSSGHASASVPPPAAAAAAPPPPAPAPPPPAAAAPVAPPEPAKALAEAAKPKPVAAPEPVKKKVAHHKAAKRKH